MWEVRGRGTAACGRKGLTLVWRWDHIHQERGWASLPQTQGRETERPFPFRDTEIQRSLKACGGIPQVLFSQQVN